ncbi:MAG: hypothetical protein ACXVFV_03845 [Mycobacteriales bacterium]
MTAVLLAVVTVTVLAALGCALALAVTVVPFVVSVDLAERRGQSTTAWGTLAAVVALAVPYLALKGHTHPVLLLPVAALAWVVPLGLSLSNDRSR